MVSITDGFNRGTMPEIDHILSYIWKIIIIKRSEISTVNGIDYQKDCEYCAGTGMVYSFLYDPPEQCDCCDYFYDPDVVIEED